MKRTTSTIALASLLIGSALTLLPAGAAGAVTPPTVTGRASAMPGNIEPADAGASTDTAVSGNGRFVTFTSESRLVPTDTDLQRDVYVKDLLTDAVERISVTPDGSAPSGHSRNGAISPDGRYVAFWSWATNLVPGDTLNKADVFVRDRTLRITERVSVSSSEQQGNGASPATLDDTIDLSSDGRYVTFTSSATNMGDPGADTDSDVHVRDRTAGTTAVVSVSDAEAAAVGNSYGPSISADGRYVAFESDAANLVTSDTNAGRDIFVRDRTGNTTTRVSLHDNDTQAAGQSFRSWIDDGGSNVAFASNAKLTATDTNGTTDVYVRARNTNVTTLVSAGLDGKAIGDSTQPTISGNGAAVAFQSTSAAAVAGGANGYPQIYVRTGGVTTRATRATASANQVGMGDSSHPRLSADGKVVAFDSKANNLVTGDTGKADSFFRKAAATEPFGSTASFATTTRGQIFDSVDVAKANAATVAMDAGASPQHVVVGWVNDPAVAGKRPALIRLYVAYFKRLPDLGGMNYWLGKLNGGMKLDQVSAKFAASNEFKTKYGNTTNTQFVTLVYNNVFDRAPDPGGLSHWVAKLNGGMSRGTVMTNFSESSEGKRHFAPWVNTTLLGLGLLDTLPTGSLATSMIGAAEVDSPEAAAVVLLQSPQYLATLS